VYYFISAENPKIRIFTGQKNITFIPEAGKKICTKREKKFHTKKNSIKKEEKS